MRWLARLLLAAAITLAATACTSLTRQPGVVAVDALFTSLPADTDVTAVIEVQHDTARTALLLALSTGVEARLSVLSPQGIPLFQARPAQGHVKVKTQASLNATLAPETLLSYLLMTFGETDAIRRQALSQGYTMLAASQLREYKSQQDPGARVVIEYRGTPPWYESATITDTGAGLVIRITTLEARHVQPG